jgi:hypothetical protein
MIPVASPLNSRMSTGAAMADKKKGQGKKPERKTERVELLAPKSWVQRMTETAEGLGLSLAAFIRLACEEKARRLEGQPDGS